MKSRLLVLLLLLLWVLAALGCTAETQWEQHIQAGMTAYERGDYEEAIAD